MKKTNKNYIFIILTILLLIFVFSFPIWLNYNNKKKIESSIASANAYILENEFDKNTFSNVLQNTLNNSLVYNVDENEYIILYKNVCYQLNNNILKKSQLKYMIFDNIEQALKCNDLSIDTLILTKGYHKQNDNGNACYIVKQYTENSDILSYHNDDKTFSLVYYNTESTINIYQMGYNGEQTIDNYINYFTKNLSYNNIFIPSGEYRITNYFDIDEPNKGYYAYNSKLYSDDTYSPNSSNGGCLFYVHNNIKNININGFNLTIKVNKKIETPLLGFLTCRNVDGLFVNNCSFVLPEEAHIYSSSGIIDLFTGWKNVIVKNCHMENHSSTIGGGGIGVRDIYNQTCKNALFENNYLYSNCKDEVIAIFSGVDTSLGYTEDGSGLIENVTFKNNTIVGGEQKLEYTKNPRVVGITIGYQKSLVKEIYFIDNTINMYSANYFLLYGKAENVKFENNNINIDSTYMENLYKIIRHNPYADNGNEILFNKNNFELINNSSINTIAESESELSFTNNTLIGQKVYRLFDSKSKFENNNINFSRIEDCVYRNILNTYNNKITATSINVVYEFFNLNFTNDVIIDSDYITTNSIACNFMMFNGSEIYFNNHSITFKNFIFDTNKVQAEKYFYLAYGTEPIKDKAIINFENSSISFYENKSHNYVVENGEKKVEVNFINNNIN